jgi:hypothetical protein
MIRITVETKSGNEHIFERRDVESAAKWVIQDAYFGNPEVTKVTWEKIEPHEHLWSVNGRLAESHGLRFTCDCGATASMTNDEITKFENR